MKIILAVMFIGGFSACAQAAVKPVLILDSSAWSSYIETGATSLVYVHFDEEGQTNFFYSNMDGNESYCYYTFDENGNLLSVSDEAGGDEDAQAYFYNEKGLLVSNQTVYGSRWFYEYDSEDRLIQKSDENGFVWASYTYDDEGRLSYEEEYLSRLYTTSYMYDENGLLTEASGADETGIFHQILYLYDAEQNLTNVTYYDKNGNGDGVVYQWEEENYSYDESGKLIRFDWEKHYDIGHMEYFYDSDSRLIREEEFIYFRTEPSYTRYYEYAEGENPTALIQLYFNDSSQ